MAKPLKPNEIMDAIGNVEVFASEKIAGFKGLRAKGDFAANAKIFDVDGQLVPVRTLRTLQLDENLHIDPVTREGQPELGYYLNHSCDANAYAFVTQHGPLPVLRIYALKAIRKGQEITVDYAFMESEIAHACKCCCGALRCRRKLVGFKQLSAQEVQAYLDGKVPVSKHLLDLLVVH